MPLNMRRIVTATVLTIAVGLVAVPGASAYTYPIGVVSAHATHQVVRNECIIPSDAPGAMQLKTTHRLRVFAHKDNNMRSISVQTRLFPRVPPVGLGSGYPWGVTVKQTVVADRNIDIKMKTLTPPRLNDDFDLEIKLKFDRDNRRDWKKHWEVPFGENFCQGGSFPG